MDLSTLIGRTRNTISINQILRNQLMWMMLLRIVLYTLLLAISYVFRGAQLDVIVLPSNLLNLLLLIVFLTTIFSGFALMIYEGNLRKFGFAQNLLDTFFVALLVFFSGSSRSIFTSVFFFPIVAGGLILPRKGGLVAASSATLLYGTILFLEAYGLYPAYLQEYMLVTSPNPMAIFNHFAVQGLTFFLAAILSALFGLRLQKTESALTDSIKNFDQLAILYKQIFDNISTGIITIDATSIITSANNAIKKITGLQHQNLIGQKLESTFPNLDLSGDNVRLTTDFIKNDGSKVRIGYSHMSIEHSSTEQSSHEASHKIITLQDISQIEKLERQVRQTEKLAAIGVMSASIAHDFRNPLTAISGSAQVLANEFSSGGSENYSNFQLTNIILRESNRLIETIGDFLRFSRPEIANCSWFSLRSCIEEVLQVCKADPAWPESAQIFYDFDRTVDIWADEKEMFTVFTHLLLNGLAFCPPGKERITIQAREIKKNAHQEAIEISIQDNGPGIAESKRDQIFEPFFTTRAEGTGLGLAIVKQTIIEHQGSIDVNCGKNGGAIFTFTLPLPQ
ncbi:MAG: PAS domain S-box protein [Proteobacteria bacterium]|nr:PAS domain S-box protein [Pseudomonadota bacterium]